MVRFHLYSGENAGMDFAPLILMLFRALRTCLLNNFNTNVSFSKHHHKTPPATVFTLLMLTVSKCLVSSDNVGELINNTAILEHNTASKSTCATFRNMVSAAKASKLAYLPPSSEPTPCSHSPSKRSREPTGRGRSQWRRRSLLCSSRRRSPSQAVTLRTE